MAKLKENILFLTIKEPYFTQIKNGSKKYEYRQITDFWERKFKKQYDFILFQNGYSLKSPRMLVEFISVNKHILQDKNLLFESNIEVFALELGNKINFNNYIIYKNDN